MNKNIKDMKIVIVGCGPSGLGLARVLQLKGCKNVKVYERSTHKYSRLQGSSLDLHVDLGQKLIVAAGLENEFRVLSRPDGECFSFGDKNGNLKIRKPFLKISSKRPEIDRGDLRDILMDSLLPDTIEWDYHFKSLKQIENDQVELTFTNNDGSIIKKPVIADLVIGCDGVHSKVRKYVTLDQFKPEYMGITMIEGEVANAKNSCPEIYNLVNQGLLFVMEDGIVMIAQQKTDGNIVFSFAQKVEKDWIKNQGFDLSPTSNSSDIKRFLKNKLIPKWSPIFHKLIDQSMAPFKPRVLYRAPINQEWKSQSNITIIGDAAHSISPFAGLGCNIALYDSYELATILTKDIDCISQKPLLEKIENFENNMLNRWRTAAKETMENENSAFLPNGIEALKKRIGGIYYYFNCILSVNKVVNYINYLTDLILLTK
ncbi:hypothetical protein RB653_005472 [Dictyostelium firmibasis]|uniref:FAD-binding domain-containing protein n=1 Tax=Dictyostelium firmibasis TaxID=79012 RepID=A0AAN7U7E8_9MYCE